MVPIIISLFTFTLCIDESWTNESGIVSSANISGGITVYFHDSKYEVDYDGLELAPCMYVDDIARLADTLETVQDGNKRLEAKAESKLLTFHDRKSGMIIVGSKKFKRKVMKEFSEKSVMFNGKVMRVFEHKII